MVSFFFNCDCDSVTGVLYVYFFEPFFPTRPAIILSTFWAIDSDWCTKPT